MIAIVTDSTVYLEKKEALDLDVRIVPINYTVMGNPYNETYSDQNGSFEELIFGINRRCTTSQASVSAFTSVFEELLRQGCEVLCIVISSRLSGTYSSASIAARELDREKIIVVDSLSTAGGLYLLVKKAKELISGGASLKETAGAIEKARNNVGIAFSVNDMDALRRSGRIRMAKQSIGTILNIRPILLCEDGAVVSHGLARGRSEQIKKLVDLVPENAKEIVIHHLGEKSSTAQLFEELYKKSGNNNVRFSRLGPSLGIHLGLGVIGVAWII